MANSSSYPSALDSNLELPRSDNGVTEINGDVVNSLRDAILSIEGALGINPQGNALSTSVRINKSLDLNGNIRPTALDGVGLVSLPIINGQVSDTAGIEESKLNLDYATTFLKGRVDSVVTDLGAANDTFNAFTVSVLSHYDGVMNRHDGYQIDLIESVLGAANAESALHLLNIYIENTSSSLAETMAALAILQSAVNDLIALGNLTEKHQDTIHANSIALTSRGESGTQGNLDDTILASTVFKTEVSLASNALQVMRPNVSRVTGTTPSLSSLVFNNKDQIRILAGGVNRSALDVDLGTLIPVTNLNDIVDKINSEARLSVKHYPISAYNVNGRLTIAHNMQGGQFTIEIVSAIPDSAHIELGFSGIVDTEISWSDGYSAAVIGGKTITDMKPLIRITYNHSSGSLDEIYPNAGDLLELFDISPEANARIICNIFAHEDTGASVDGTYYITDIIGSGNIGFQLNADIPYGEFNIDIVADSISFESGGSSRGEIYDIFFEPITGDGYDGYGKISKSLRAEYITNAGVIIRGISKDFPSASMSWEVTANKELQILESGVAGNSVSIPTNFRGQLRVFAPDNINSALFEVIGNPSSTGAKSISPINAFGGETDKLYLSSVHYAGDYGNNIATFITDRRVFSNSIEDKYFDIQDVDPLEDITDELRNNGIIRGFDVISNTSTTIRVRGGRVVVNGKIINVETKNITIDSFTDGTRLLAIDYNGLYQVYDNDEPGFSISELTSGTSNGDHLRITPIVEFVTTTSALSGSFTDRRLIIANIDRKLENIEDSFGAQIAQIEGTISGSLSGITNLASTTLLPEYVSARLTTDNTNQTGLFNPFNTTTYGGTAVTDASKGITYNSATGRFTVVSSGDYFINVVAYIDHATSAVLSQFDLFKNNTTIIWEAVPYAHTVLKPLDRNISIIVSLLAGDYIELRIDSQTSSNLKMVEGTTLVMIKVGADDENVSEITASANLGFTNIDSAGFTNGAGTPRRFDLDSLNKESIFKSKGVTHVNIMMEAIYADESGSDPFGTSGLATVELGANITTGRLNGTTEEKYVVVKTINSTNLPANSVTEQYIASIPLSLFGTVSNNIVFDINPRVKINGSLFVDGGTGGGSTPIITFDRFRIVTSSYSIAGDILEQDGTNVSLATTVSDNL